MRIGEQQNSVLALGWLLPLKENRQGHLTGRFPVGFRSISGRFPVDFRVISGRFPVDFLSVFADAARAKWRPLCLDSHETC